MPSSISSIGAGIFHKVFLCVNTQIVMVVSHTFQIRIPSFGERLRNWRASPEFIIDADMDKSLIDGLRVSLSPLAIQKPMVTLFYPGCGADILWPLVILDSIARDADWRVIAVDDSDCFDALICGIQAITKNNVFRRDKDKVGFSFNAKRITLEFQKADALSAPIPKCDIFMERAFNIIHSKDPQFISRVASNASYLLVTDMAFPSPDGFQRHVAILPDWGFYKCPAVYVRRNA